MIKYLISIVLLFAVGLTAVTMQKAEPDGKWVYTDKTIISGYLNLGGAYFLILNKVKSLTVLDIVILDNAITQMSKKDRPAAGEIVKWLLDWDSNGLFRPTGGLWWAVDADKTLKLFLKAEIKPREFYEFLASMQLITVKPTIIETNRVVITHPEISNLNFEITPDGITIGGPSPQTPDPADEWQPFLALISSPLTYFAMEINLEKPEFQKPFFGSAPGLFGSAPGLFPVKRGRIQFRMNEFHALVTLQNSVLLQQATLMVQEGLNWGKGYLRDSASSLPPWVPVSLITQTLDQIKIVHREQWFGVGLENITQEQVQAMGNGLAALFVAVVEAKIGGSKIAAGRAQWITRTVDQMRIALQLISRDIRRATYPTTLLPDVFFDPCDNENIAVPAQYYLRILKDGEPINAPSSGELKVMSWVMCEPEKPPTQPGKLIRNEIFLDHALDTPGGPVGNLRIKTKVFSYTTSSLSAYAKSGNLSMTAIPEESSDRVFVNDVQFIEFSVAGTIPPEKPVDFLPISIKIRTLYPNNEKVFKENSIMTTPQVGIDTFQNVAKLAGQDTPFSSLMTRQNNSTINKPEELRIYTTDALRPSSSTAKPVGGKLSPVKTVDDSSIEDEFWGYVEAPSGLTLRDGPSRKAKKIVLIPDKTKVRVIQKNGPEDTIEGIKNNWLRIEFGEKSGWAFGGMIGEVGPKTASGVFVDSQSNVRSEPTTTATIIDVPSVGTQFSLLEQKGKWFKVQYGKVIGWTNRINIKLH